MGHLGINWPEMERQLRQFLPLRAVVSARQELLSYDCDGLTLSRHQPPLVVLPETTAQVAAAVKLCHQKGVPFVARGSGTGLSGGAVAEIEALVIATSRMRQVLAIDLENQRITVQPGVINSWVTRAVAGDGFYYAPDPSSQVACSIGGNVAENSGGVHCLKYGVTSNHVLGLEVVLPDGSTTCLGSELDETPELDLRGAFIGSEGTLGIATAITLRLLRAPQSVAVLLADFTSMEAAGEAVRQVTAAGLLPAGMEMMDRLTIEAVNDYFGVDEYPRDAAALLLIELDGQEGEVAAAVQLATQLCSQAGARTVRQATDAQERALLWKGRKSAVSALGRRFPSYYLQDGVVPRSALPRVLAAIEQLSASYGLPVANVFHAGDGNLHPLILYSAQEPGIEERVKALGADILRLCVDEGGSISGEHGVGSDKRCYLDWMYGPDDLATMQLVRRAFDPLNIANPGKIFPTPSSCGESARRVAVLQAQGQALPDEAVVF
ncbi:FAD-binding protein [Cyanobium sp. BA5m-21]|uniref:FAD-linked oxidase C-terminal domain-containing protein n=1 Tax=unclassified Cyanobium TaxID=2627006 RepID=UPI0020CBB40E|nr:MULTISPECIES: FAD-linked oxidase C-terminal domain-containing protein [unclassified Cyanobium]MCP9902647.1 FAD-binding protein [Cyanobium sp. BA5m-10]MCP9906354.1 FAD-binding protein [Cyanobium sp. BA5m-21]